MEYLLKASVITAIFYLCYKLFLQKETFFESNRWFLLAGLVASCCIPFVIIPIYIEQPISNYDFTAIYDSQQTIQDSPQINYLIYASWIYSIGVVFFFAKLLLEFSSLIRLLKNKAVVKKNGYKHIEVEDTISPFSFFNYIVYNPKEFDSEEIEHIINHEKVHANQVHSIDIICMQLATILLWFNPIVWLYKKEVQQNLEFIADQNAQQIANCEQSYQQLLLKASLSKQQLVLTNNFYTSLIKKRIIMLHKSKSNNLNLFKYALVIPLLALFLMSFNTKEIYLNNNITENVVGDIEMVIISKDFTEADFKKIQKEFADKGITLKFKSIKRNSAGEITGIKIDASTKKSNASFSTSSGDAIKPIKIVFNNEDQSISIGNGKGNHLNSENHYSIHSDDGTHKIIKSGSGSNVFVVSDDHDGEEHKVEVIIKDKNGNVKKDGNVFVKKRTKVIHLDEDEDSHGKKHVYVIKEEKDGKEVTKEIIINGDGNHTWVEDEEHDVKVIKGKGNKRMMFISSDDGEESPLIIIDGKESNREALEKLGPDAIKSVNILKDDTASKTYGEKGKHGVIEVTTKK